VNLYNYFCNHPDRCDDYNYSTDFSIKIKLKNGRKVDILTMFSTSSFLEWYYATLETSNALATNASPIIGNQDLSIKKQRVAYFEKKRSDFRELRCYGNEYSFLLEPRFLPPFNYSLITDLKEMFDPYILKSHITPEEYGKYYEQIDYTANGNIEKIINQKKETEMSELKVEVVNTIEESKLIVATPGVKESNINIRIDNEDNIIYVNITENKDLDKDVLKIFEFGKSCSQKLDKKYDVDNTSWEIADGILVITVPVSSTRIKSIPAKIKVASKKD
jgi:HSP20 family molecular chaperone IbpA